LAIEPEGQDAGGEEAERGESPRASSPEDVRKHEFLSMMASSFAGKDPGSFRGRMRSHLQVSHRTVHRRVRYFHPLWRMIFVLSLRG
jgi:hypothetical protein